MVCRSPSGASGLRGAFPSATLCWHRRSHSRPMSMQRSQWRTGADRLRIAGRGLELHCLAPAVGRKVTPSFVKIVRAHGMCSTVMLSLQVETAQLSKQRLLERLEAENAQLRGRVVHLMLQIQALREGARCCRHLAGFR